VRARLINLGFIAGEGEHDLAEPMALFRACHGLPALDDPLSPGAREDLLFAHGS
jgi:hypothetical protein